MLKIEITEEKSNTYFSIKRNDDLYTISEITKMLRYIADSLEKGNAVHDGNFLYIKTMNRKKEKNDN